jgi:hypothetical protein
MTSVSRVFAFVVRWRWWASATFCPYLTTLNTQTMLKTATTHTLHPATCFSFYESFRYIIVEILTQCATLQSATQSSMLHRLLPQLGNSRKSIDYLCPSVPLPSTNACVPTSEDTALGKYEESCRLRLPFRALFHAATRSLANDRCVQASGVCCPLCPFLHALLKQALPISRVRTYRVGQYL